MAEIVNTLATAMLGSQRKPDMATRRRGRRMVMFPATPRSQRARVSGKIETLVAEGTPQKKAVAMALNMARAGRLGPRGGYRRVGT